MIEAYPLAWPPGYKRTPAHARVRSQFKQTMDRAQRALHDEISRMGGRDLIVSTDIPVRNDGMLYADWMRRKIDDPGVAIYFKRNGTQVSMCCDQYTTVWENIYALAKSIEALRGVERWGASDFLERAFTGFKALPESTLQEKDIWSILGLNEKPESTIIIHQAYKQQAKKAHPDGGGSTEEFHRLNEAYRMALKFFNAGVEV